MGSIALGAAIAVLTGAGAGIGIGLATYQQGTAPRMCAGRSYGYLWLCNCASDYPFP